MNRQITLAIAMVSGLVCLVGGAFLVMAANRTQPPGLPVPPPPPATPAATPAGPQAMAVDLGHDEEPTQIAWSKAGDWLSVVAGEDGGRSLWLSQRGGTAMTAATQVRLPGDVPASRIGDVAWHPEGLVAFSAAIAGGNDRIWFFTPGGSTAVELIEPTKAPGTLRMPVFSADGGRVAFVRLDGETLTLDEWSQKSTQVFSRIELSTGIADAPSYSAFGDAIDYAVCTTPECGLQELGADGVVKPLGIPAARVFVRRDGFVWYARNGESYDLVTNVGGTERILGTGAKLPGSASVAVSGGSVAWTDGALLHVTKLADGATVEVPTGCESIRDVAISARSDRTTVAWIGLKGGRWGVEVLDL